MQRLIRLHIYAFQVLDKLPIGLEKNNIQKVFFFFFFFFFLFCLKTFFVCTHLNFLKDVILKGTKKTYLHAKHYP